MSVKNGQLVVKRGDAICRKSQKLGLCESSRSKRNVNQLLAAKKPMSSYPCPMVMDVAGASCRFSVKSKREASRCSRMPAPEGHKSKAVLPFRNAMSAISLPFYFRET